MSDCARRTGDAAQGAEQDQHVDHPALRREAVAGHHEGRDHQAGRQTAFFAQATKDRPDEPGLHDGGGNAHKRER